MQQRLSSLRGSNPPRGSEGAPRVALAVKSPPASAGGRRDAVPSPGREAPLEEGTATHSRILAWRTPGTEEAAVRGAAEPDTPERAHRRVSEDPQRTAAPTGGAGTRTQTRDSVTAGHGRPRRLCNSTRVHPL